MVRPPAAQLFLNRVKRPGLPAQWFRPLEVFTAGPSQADGATSVPGKIGWLKGWLIGKLVIFVLTIYKMSSMEVQMRLKSVMAVIHLFEVSVLGLKL